LQQLFKVLIADDEPNIREGIRYSIDWHEIGMEVVAEAEDGEEALELALKYKVDVLLADLNMPIMNGLTLIKNIRENNKKCSVIVISGYDDFTYAQEALRLQVDDYILKPIKPNNLTQVLKKVSERLQTQTAQKKYMEIASSNISENTLLIQEQFCRNWVDGTLKNDKIKEQLHFWGLPEVPPNILTTVFIQELEIKQPHIKMTDRELFIFGVKNILTEELVEEKKMVFSDKSGLLIILLWGEAHEESFSRIENSIVSYLQVTPILFSEVITGKFDALPAVYENCKKKLHEEAHVSPIVRRAQNFIRQQYTSSTLTLESIAQQLQVSPAYLSRIIKQGLGTTFVSLVTEMRIKKAIKLLHSSNLQVCQIAEEVGYESQHYFSTAFKKIVGVSPNQYRKGCIQLSREKTKNY
jgi:two-component system, response regulator YesN